MDTVGNINHAVSIVGHWIFDSKRNTPIDNIIVESHTLYFERGKEYLPCLKQCFLQSDMSTTKTN